MSFTNIFRAVEDGTVEDVKYFIEEQGINVNTKFKDGATPMHFAAGVGQVEIIKYLAALGADVNARDNNGHTPILMAATAGKVKSIKCLAALGADVNARDNDGSTPISGATLADTGQIECIKCLAALGADVNAKDNGGDTPIFVAAMAGTDRVECIKCLVALGADVNVRDNIGRTPIFAAVAAESGQIAAMECLKELGAKLDVKDNNGETAVDLADVLKETEAAKWLRANGVGYEQLVQKMDKASTENEYQELVQKFRAMNGYKDTAALADKCDTQYRTLKEQREERERSEQYKRLVQEMDKASTEKEYQELVQKFRAMNGFENTAELAHDCETSIKNIQNAAKIREHLSKIAPISPVLLAVLTVVILIFGLSYIQQTEITGASILGGLIFAIPFLVIYLTDIDRTVLKGVFIAIGVILSIFTVYFTGSNNGVHALILAAYFICNLASYILAMIFPKDLL